MKKTVRPTKKKGVKKTYNKTKIAENNGLDPETIKLKVRHIISEVLGVPASKITMKARFIEDLGMDSMKALEILAAIERWFKVQVDEEDLQKMVNLEEIMKLIDKLIKKSDRKKRKK